MAKALTLPSIFKEVSKTLSENEAVLNEADTYNHNHGTNMAAAFQTVSKAVAKKKDLPVSEQLTYASKVLQDSTSSSAKIYAQGLANAAQKFQGKQLNENTVGLLIDSMMGIQEPAQAASGAAEKSLLGSLLGGLAGAQQTPSGAGAGGDLLGSLLGGLAGAQQAPAGAGTGDDLLSSLLGGLTGAAAPSGSKPVKIDTAQLLKAGMAYMQAKQSGSSDINALLSALMAGSRMGTQNYRTQSGTLVANSLLKALAQMGQ